MERNDWKKSWGGGPGSTSSERHERKSLVRPVFMWSSFATTSRNKARRNAPRSKTNPGKGITMAINELHRAGRHQYYPFFAPRSTDITTVSSSSYPLSHLPSLSLPQFNCSGSRSLRMLSPSLPIPPRDLCWTKSRIPAERNFSPPA